MPDPIVEEARAPQPVQADLAAVRTQVVDLEREARTLIQQRPVTAVLAALGAGYAIARLVSRVTSRRHA